MGLLHHTGGSSPPGDSRKGWAKCRYFFVVGAIEGKKQSKTSSLRSSMFVIA